MIAKLIRITTVPISMNIILKGQLAFMNQFFEVIGITSPDEKHLYSCEEREGIRIIPVLIQRNIAPLKDLHALWNLFWIFKREKPNIVHTHTPKAGLLGLLAARLAFVPIRLHTVGGMPMMESRGAKRKLLELTEKLTYSCANKVYPNSYGLKDFIVNSKLCPKTKLKVLANGSSNGVDVTYFDPKIFEDIQDKLQKIKFDLDIYHEDFVFLFVGRLAKDKGIAELIEVFNLIHQNNAQTKLLLIGPFEQSNSILPEALKKEILSNPSIIAPGRFDDVRPYYTISHAYVFPSYREGFPNSLMEAGSMGLPIIASDINGCNEIVIHKKNGLLIEPKNVNSLSSAMLEILENNSLRENMANCSREIVVNKFRNELIWKEIYKEYDTLLSTLN